MPTKRRTLTASSSGTHVHLAVADIEISDVIQPRVRMDPETIEEYAILYREQEEGTPEPLPPIDVFQIEGTYYVADGFHRLHAAQQAGRTTLPCHVYQGTRQEALRHGALANLPQRGLAYTQWDKQRVLERLITDPEVGQRSDRSLARDLGISHVTVGRARQRLVHVATLTHTLTTQPTTAAAPAAKRQEQMAALLDLPMEDVAILTKHKDLQPAEVVEDIARRMADRNESAEEAIRDVTRQLRSQAALRRDLSSQATRGWSSRPRESAPERAQRKAEEERQQRYYTLWGLLDFIEYLPSTPSAEEAAQGEEPYIPHLSIEEMVAAVLDKDRPHIMECLAQAYTFLDAVTDACQAQGWARTST